MSGFNVAHSFMPSNISSNTILSSSSSSLPSSSSDNTGKIRTSVAGSSNESSSSSSSLRSMAFRTIKGSNSPSTCKYKHFSPTFFSSFFSSSGDACTANDSIACTQTLLKYIWNTFHDVSSLSSSSRENSTRSEVNERNPSTASFPIRMDTLFLKV